MPDGRVGSFDVADLTSNHQTSGLIFGRQCQRQGVLLPVCILDSYYSGFAAPAMADLSYRIYVETKEHVFISMLVRIIGGHIWLIFFNFALVVCRETIHMY